VSRLLSILFLFSNIAFADHTQSYFIKGMTCGMCVQSIKGALNKASNLNIVESQVEVGFVTLKTKQEEKGLDCKVTRVIEGSTEYKVFLDKEYLKPACPKS
jgi:copper chaperone CopZ